VLAWDILSVMFFITSGDSSLEILGARPRGDGPGVYAPSGVQVAGQGSADSKLLTYY